MLEGPSQVALAVPFSGAADPVTDRLADETLIADRAPSRYGAGPLL